MYGKILVPLDGSALAERVPPYVRPLAKALVASIELLRTIPPAGLELADPNSTNSQDQALEYLRSISVSLNDLGSPSPVPCARGILLPGSPVKQKRSLAPSLLCLLTGALVLLGGCWAAWLIG
jgi:nucleotide-binding universal stress UspA family protein